ncbi:MAG: electron transport complex subunit E [Treponema sp.]|nr:electron transport complex subunit E [Treponema sp.]MCL2273092.1 electron transport complex subunit E [Treponema sp.]
MSKKISILLNGIIKENPVLVLILGICPALAVSTQAENAIGMGLATTFVLLGSNITISLLRKSIPNKVRIPCYIILIAGFTTIVQMIVEAYAYGLYQALGIFLPLIAVNCIVFARAEMYANKNGVLDSAVDAIGMGAGFTIALLMIATLREVLGSGTWFGFKIPVLNGNSIEAFTLAPGGFIAFGIIIAIINKVSKGKAIKRDNFGCEACPSKAVCGKFAGVNAEGAK